MKKILPILSAVSLSTIITTNIIACKKPNTNNNKPIEPKSTRQQPPTNSNWKLIDDIKNEFNTENNKFYFFLNLFDTNKYDTYLVKNKNSNIKIGENNRWDLEIYKPKYFVMFSTANIKNIYRWDGVGEPTMPTINTNTGEIKNWNKNKIYQNKFNKKIKLITNINI